MRLDPNPRRGDAPEGAPAHPEASARGRSRLVAALALAAVVPFVVGLVVLRSRPWWYPGGDEALVSLRAWDVGRETPLVGVYSRYGWNHPGPMLFWLLAAPVRLFGDAGRGAAVGVIAVNALWAVAVVVLAARRAGLVAGAGAVALVAWLVAAEPTLVWSAWNPDVTRLAFLAYLVAAWSVAEGDDLGWPVAVVTGMFCIQGHVGHVTPVLAVGVVALALLVVPWWRSGRPRPTRRGWLVFVAGAVAAVALVIPPLIDQFTGSGNVGNLLEWFGEGGPEPLGVSEGLTLLSRQFLPWGPWAGGPEVVVPFLGTTEPLSPWWLALPVLALASTIGVAMVHRDVTVLRLSALVAAAGAASVAAVAAVTPPAYPYLYGWVHMVAAALWATVVLGWARAVVAWGAAARSPRSPGVVPSRPRPSRAVVAAVVALAVVPVTWSAVTLSGAALPESPSGRAIGELLPSARAQVPPGASFAIGSDSEFSRVVEGLGVALVETGREVVVDRYHSLAWGSFREGDIDGDGVTRLWVISGQDLMTGAVPAGWTEVARSDPLDEAGTEERERLRAELVAEAEAIGRPGLVSYLDTGPWPLLLADDTGLDAESVRAYVRLARQGQPHALFVREVGPPTAAPTPR